MCQIEKKHFLVTFMVFACTCLPCSLCLRHFLFGLSQFCVISRAVWPAIDHEKWGERLEKARDHGKGREPEKGSKKERDQLFGPVRASIEKAREKFWDLIRFSFFTFLPATAALFLRHFPSFSLSRSRPLDHMFKLAIISANCLRVCLQAGIISVVSDYHRNEPAIRCPDGALFCGYGRYAFIN